MTRNVGTGICLLGLIATGLVVSCGGGGGGGPRGLTANSATVVIDDTNAIDIIRNVEGTAAFANSFIFDTLVLLGSSTNMVATASSANAGYSVSASAQSGTYCNGGTADVSESGLVATFVFIDCQDFVYTSNYLGQVQIPGLSNGTLRIQVAATSQSETDFRATLTLTDLSVDDGVNAIWGNGALILDYLEIPDRIVVDVSAQALDFAFNGQARSLEDYSVLLVRETTEGTESSEGGITSSDFDLLAWFETPATMVTAASDQWPSSGNRVIYGENKARIRVTALSSTTARVELDLDDDELDEFETSCQYDWDVLLGDNPLVACAP